MAHVASKSGRISTRPTLFAWDTALFPQHCNGHFVDDHDKLSDSRPDSNDAVVSPKGEVYSPANP